MKNIHILTSVFFIVVAITIFSGDTVFSASEFSLPDPGLTPESPIYFLDIWDENARLFFSRSDTSRLRRYKARVLERLSEAETLAGRGISATQRALELYRADMPFFYAVAERLDNALTLADGLRMASYHLDVLDHISERTDFEKKRFVTTTKIFVIEQQLQSFHMLAKQESAEALQIFGDALQRRMARIREVSIDDENNQEALKEYAAYMSETEKIMREWAMADVEGSSPAAFLKQAVAGHEETLLGPVHDRLPVTLKEELLLVVNGVRKLSEKDLLLQLPPPIEEVAPAF